MTADTADAAIEPLCFSAQFFMLIAATFRTPGRWYWDGPKFSPHGSIEPVQSPFIHCFKALMFMTKSVLVVEAAHA
jgi:hypothetical protein